MTEASGAVPLPEADAKEVRRITHAINNALELIVQASYLVNTTELTEDAKGWMKLLDQGIRQTADYTRELRDYVQSRSA